MGANGGQDMSFVPLCGDAVRGEAGCDQKPFDEWLGLTLAALLTGHGYVLETVSVEVILGSENWS